MVSTDDPGRAPQQMSLEAWLDSDATAPGSARTMVREAAEDLDASVCDDAVLVASELVANAAEHGSDDGLRIRLRRTGVAGLEVSVFNRLRPAGSGIPERPWRMPTGDAARGRGLAVVEKLSSYLGVERSGSGVEVTATVLA